MFELFDHTADLGLRARSDTPEGLFADAALALRAALVENPDAVEPRKQRTVTVAGTDREYLLFDWLDALLRLFDSERFLLARTAVRFDPAGLTAEVWGEPVDATRHQLSHEVKAITYHGLHAAREADGTWLAEVIVDI
jgi:SHS2 domain-containing protein